MQISIPPKADYSKAGVDDRQFTVMQHALAGEDVNEVKQTVSGPMRR